MRRRLVVAIGCLLGTLNGCGLIPLVPKARFRVDEGSFKQQVNVICALPVRLAISHPKAKELEDTLSAELVAELQRGGFRVPAPQKVADIRVATIAMMGGVYDPYSGKADRAKREAILSAVRSRWRAELECDAILYSTVVRVTAPFVFGDASWDGVTDPVTTDIDHGYVPALSLWTSIEGPDGEEQYFGTGGIQVLAVVQGLFNREFEAVEEEFILATPERRIAAIRESLKPLLPAITTPVISSRRQEPPPAPSGEMGTNRRQPAVPSP